MARIYEWAEGNRIPVTLHTGTSIFPRARIKYGDPLYLDDVATDFPRLKLVIAHGGRPINSWANTCFFLLRRHRNTYLDISGIPPKSLLTLFPRLNEITERVMFGSDWYTLGVESIRKNAEDLYSIGLERAAVRKILHDNAVAIVSPN